jgi:hypothetical protein
MLPRTIERLMFATRFPAVKDGIAFYMPRQLRIERAGAIYRVMSRGDRREAIFLDEGHRTISSRS